MKILPYIIGFILLANFFACQRETTYPLAMQQAESIMNTRPDSALYLLQNMTDTVSMLPEEAQMYYPYSPSKQMTSSTSNIPATLLSTESFSFMKNTMTTTA